MLKRLPWGWIALYATMTLFAVSSAIPLNSMWGINHLAFLSGGWWWVFAVVMSAMVVLTLLREPTPQLDRLIEWTSDFLFKRGVWPKVGVATACMILFWVCRTPTHFLGDGYTLLGGLGKEGAYIVKWTDPGAVLLIRLFQSISGVYTKTSALVTFQVLSVVSGWIVVFNAFAISRYLSSENRSRLLALIGILSSGTILLFCGYVELYPPLWLLASTFFVFALRYLRGRGGPLPLLMMLAATCAVHLQALVLLPGVAYAILNREYHEKRGIRFGRGLGLIILGTVMCGFAAYVWLYSTRIEFETIFLPLFRGRPRSPEYAVFTLQHMLDIANLILLIYPLILPFIVLAIRTKGEDQRDSVRTTLWLFAGGSSLFLVLVDPVLGLGRDWDLFSLTVLPLMLVVLFQARRGMAKLVSRKVVTFALVGWFIAGSYVLMNTDVSTTENRIHELLRYYGTKNRSGWSILSNYYREAGNRSRRHDIATEMGNYFPEDTLLVRAYDLFDQGDYRGARNLAHQLVLLDPFRGDYYQILANAQGKLQEFDSSETNYGIAIRLIPYNAMIKNELGQVYLSERKYGEAESMFRRILDYDPSLTMVSEGLALAYYYQGLDDSALRIADGLFASNSSSPGGHLIYLIVNLRNGDLIAARQHYEAYLVSGKTRSDYAGIRDHYNYLIK
jgi:general stress protein CsbA